MNKTNNILLWLAIAITVIAFSFWEKIKEITDIGIFYYGNALAWFVVSYFIWVNHKKLLPSFVLLCLSLNNLLDELFFDNTKFGLNEYFFAVILAIITYIRYHYARKTDTANR